MKITIEENTWNIRTKRPIKSCILTKEGYVLTRQLYNIECTKKWNDKVDVFDLTKVMLKINLMDAKSLSIEDIGKYIKDLAEDYNPDEKIKRHLEGELKGFENYNIIYE